MRNKTKCNMCGSIIYFPNNLRNSPPLLCKACEIASKLMVDFNPLQISEQYYVRNERFGDEESESDIVPLINHDEGLEPKKVRKKKSNSFEI